MRTRIRAAIGIAALGMLGPLVVSGAGSDPASASSSTAMLAQSYLSAHPGGALRGDDEVVYPDGTVYVAVPAGTLSLTQCGSGRFCMWGSTNYSGSFVYKSGDGSTFTISSEVYSLWNNRSYAARLYNDGSSASKCLAAGKQKPTLGAAYHEPDKVQLSLTSAC